MSEESNLDIDLQTVQVVPTHPEAADRHKIQHFATEVGRTLEEVSYIVKLYIDTAPIYDNLGVELYVGDQRIRRYMQFKGGIFFKVKNPDQVSALRGQRIRFRRPGLEHFVDTGVDFPVEDAAARALKLIESAQLLTQEEALRE